MPSEARTRRSPRALVLMLTLAALAGVGFFALGVWQVERLGWKEALIARVDRQLKAAPVAAPGPAQWPALEREADEYRRISLRGRFDYGREVTVRASTALGAGYWVLTPLQVDAGWWVLVNRGFVPPEQRQAVPRGELQQSVAGLLRLSEPGGSLLQKNEPAAGRWYSRDVAAIAAQQKLDGPVAPYFLDVQATAATASAWPRPGLTVVQFRNDHLVYAFTWFAMAALMVAAIGYLVVDDRRHRRLAGDSTGDDGAA